MNIKKHPRYRWCSNEDEKGDYYDNPKPYLLVSDNYPERLKPKKNEKTRLINKSNRMNDVVLNDPIVIQAPRRIDAVNSIFQEADVTMKAGQEVHLLPGFHACSGCNFHAYIDPNLDIYPVYFEKTTTDPCGEKNYTMSNKSDQLILEQLEDCRLKTRKSIDLEPVNTNSIIVSNDADEIEDSGITIFPNPSSGIFFIRFHEDSDLQRIEVFATDGKKIQEDITDFNENIKINLSNLQSGVYYLKVRTKNDIYTKKLILQ